MDSNNQAKIARSFVLLIGIICIIVIIVLVSQLAYGTNSRLLVYNLNVGQIKFLFVIVLLYQNVG